MLRLKKYGLEINGVKCKFVKYQIQYRGYNISSQGITLSDKHIKSVKDFPPP